MMRASNGERVRVSGSAPRHDNTRTGAEDALHKNVDLKFGYYFNRFSSKDFGVDIMQLFMGNVDSGAANSIYLGDRGKGSYEAHVGYLGVRLKF